MSVFPERDRDPEELADALSAEIQKTVGSDTHYGFFRSGLAVVAIGLLYFEAVGQHYAIEAGKSGYEFLDNVARFFMVQMVLGLLLFGVCMVIAIAMSYTNRILRNHFGLSPRAAAVASAGIFVAAAYGLYRLGNWALRPILDALTDEAESPSVQVKLGENDD